MRPVLVLLVGQARPTGLDLPAVVHGGWHPVKCLPVQGGAGIGAYALGHRRVTPGEASTRLRYMLDVDFSVAHAVGEDIDGSG